MSVQAGQAWWTIFGDFVCFVRQATGLVTSRFLLCVEQNAIVVLVAGKRWKRERGARRDDFFSFFSCFSTGEVEAAVARVTPLLQ